MINKAQELNAKIKELEISKEYLSLKQIISEDKYLSDLLKVINQTQKEMKDYLKNNDLKNYNSSKKTLELLKEELFKNPLINNYILIKEEMYGVLEQVVNILSE